MQQEVEAKFLSIDHELMRKKLIKAGAKLNFEKKLMRRIMLDHLDGRYKTSDQSERFRIRDEGHKVTATYKKSVIGSNYNIEHEIEVSSFDEARRLFSSLGFLEYSYQETKRESWSVGDVEVVLDEWPWVNPFIEIEGPDEDSIKNVAKILELNWADAHFGPADTVYMLEYKKMKKHDSIGYIEELIFEGKLPKYLKDRL